MKHIRKENWIKYLLIWNNKSKTEKRPKALRNEQKPRDSKRIYESYGRRFENRNSDIHCHVLTRSDGDTYGLPEYK